MKKERISDAVIRRLPRYYRFLKENIALGNKKVSSNTISEKLGITASQVRQDFSNFGEFGQQGYGYDVYYLAEQIQNILGLDMCHNIVVIGGGKIGQAIINYPTFEREGFNFLAIFDKNPEEIHVKNNVEVLRIDELPYYCKFHKVDIAVISTPKSVAQEVAALAAECGIGAIWNFAPVDIKIPGVVVENMHMSESLFLLSYKMRHKKD